MTKSRILSKTSFIRGRQCEKSLWLYLNKPFLRDKPDEVRRSLFERGHKVGFFARSLFPGGVDSSVSSGSRWADAVAKTKRSLEEGRTVIYEAAFEHEGCLIFADILVKRGDAWQVYEVKSSLRVTDVHLNDAAFQYYVITHAGVQVSAFFIVHPRADFVHRGEISPEAFFYLNDVTEKVVSRQTDTLLVIGEFRKVQDMELIPEKEVGAHCQSPYPCDFKSFCWGKPDRYHLLSLPAFQIQESSRLFQNGIRDIRQISESEAISDFHRGVIRAVMEDRVLLDKGALEKWMAAIKYPLAFFDLEMFMPAIPLYKGTRPFEHLPFAYSLRVLEHQDAAERSIFFMAPPGDDPRAVISSQLMKDLDGIQTLVLFDCSQEHAVFRKLSALFPDSKSFMEDLCKRTADLADLFVGRKVYFSAMGNSFSLKSLSGLAGIDIEKLGVSNGYEASAAYENLNEASHLFQEHEIKEALTAYSMADTEIIHRIFLILLSLMKSEDYISLN